jgi:2-oxoglutarate dehydrogenase E2 component (dihydrolipoamide succinyltransferase)
MRVIMPQLGETVSEGTVTVWHKKVGDKVAADEILFEVGTDKVETEIPSPAAGTITEILVSEGETVNVGATLAVIDDGKAAAAPAKTAEAPAAAKPAPRADATARAEERGDRTARVSRSAGRGRDKLSPVVRKLIAEHGLDPAAIDGTGRDGRIKREDVLAHIGGRGAGPAARPSRPAARAAAGPQPGETVKFDRRRKLIAEHMVRSKATSAHVLQAVEADFSGVDAARAAKGGAFKAKEGVALTYLPFVAFATCRALRDFPKINASVEDDALTVHADINLAIAVDLGEDGLVTPVIPNATDLTVSGLARRIAQLAAAARAGSLGADDFAGGTYTISNSGSFGTLITAPIINQPQVAILSTDGVRKKPVVIEGPGGDSIAIRPVGVIAQSFDHRVIDGAYSAAFLRRIKEIIETTDWRAEVA